MTTPTDLVPSPLRLHGASLLADPSGALAWPEHGLVVVADLHLEKGSAFAARGRMLPPYDTRTTLDRLEAVLHRFQPRRVICLGDSAHDRHAGARMSPADRSRIMALTSTHDWIWVAGNHDPEIPPDWGGRTREALPLDGLIFRHAAQSGATGEISGHYHPAAVVRTRIRRVRARCFVTDGERLILPAFGAYAGGLNVLNPAISRLLRPDFQAHILGRGRVHAFPRAGLAAD